MATTRFRRWVRQKRHIHPSRSESVASPEVVALQESSEPCNQDSEQQQQYSSLDDYNSIFIQARDDFLDSLPDDGKRTFAPIKSVSDVLNEISKIRVPGGGRKSLKFVQSFCNAIEPYFAAVGFISQANSFAAITWGSIVLLFQFTKGFVSFFDGLAHTLSQLASEMPQYEDLVDLLQTHGLEPSPRLKSSLITIYVELFRFFRTIVGIFNRDDKSSRHTLLVAAKLGWRPFNARFQEFRDHLLIHRDVIEKEILLLTARNTLSLNATVNKSLLLSGEDKYALREAVARAKESYKSNTQRYKYDTFWFMIDWISAPDFQLEFEIGSQKRTPNTAQWLFATKQFREWVSIPSTKAPRKTRMFDQNLLWVHGNPGCGKTILACSSIEELKLHDSSVSYFFFRLDEKGKNEASNAYRALLSQFLSSHRDDTNVLDKFMFVMLEPTGSRKASMRQVLELLEICLSLKQSRPSYMVLDGIDECYHGKNLIQDLLHVTRNGVTTKILLFSRPHTFNLPDVAPYQHSIEKQNTSDIRKYLEDELPKLSSQFPEDTDLTQLVNHLLKGADGMFLWAFLMIGYLNEASSITPSQRVRDILDITFPERLEDMYERIMNQVRNRREVDRKFACFIFTWLLYSRSALSTDAMKDAVATWSGFSDYPDFVRTVLSSCGWLVETFELRNRAYLRDNDRGFRFIHQTAKEFILTSSDKNPLYTTPVNGHYTIFRICLEYIMTRFPDRPLSGNVGTDASPDKVLDRLPLSQYAAGNWMNHVCNIKMAIFKNKLDMECLSADHSSHLCALLLGFLSDKALLKAWIEAMFLFEKHLHLEEFQAWAYQYKGSGSQLLGDGENTVFDKSLEVCKELRVLIDDWGTQLVSSPTSIWLECSSFTITQYLGKSDSMSFTPVVLRTIKTLCEISESSTDGFHIGILRIVPSSLFMILSQSGEIPSLSDLKSSCSGWLADYQVLTTEHKPRSTMKISIPLDEDEIYLHMHQSLWFGTCIPHSPQELSSLFKIQFPVAISPSLQAFTVLRDVYNIQSQDFSSLDKPYTVSRIAFDFNPDVTRRWQLRYFTDTLAQRMECLIWGCTEEAVPRLAKTYAYFLTFTPDGHHLLFRDEETGTAATLVLFELQDATQGSWSLVAWTQRALPIGKQVSTSMCHTQPLMAISFEGHVFLWPFKSKASKLFVIRHDTVGTLGGLVDLSECGLYLIIRQGPSSPAQVLQVPAYIRKLLSEEKPRHEKKVYEDTDGGTLIPLGINSLSLTELGVSSGNLIPKNSSVVAADGKAKGISVLNSSDRVAIQLWEGSSASSDNRETQVELTKLPNWNSIESVAASIPAPRAGDDKIKVILNQKLRRWNMPYEPDPRLPAIIHRDLSTLQVRQGNLLESSASVRSREREDGEASDTLESNL